MPWSHPTIPAPLVADERHLSALDWFQTQAGNEISWPEPLGGMFLVNKAKGSFGRSEQAKMVSSLVQ